MIKVMIMYKPTYSITNTILNNIAAIEQAKKEIILSPVLPLWEKVLQHDAIISSTHSSTAIEGNTLSYDDVENLYQGINVDASKKEKLEVQNYFAVLKYIDLLGKRKSFLLSESNLLRIHHLLGKGTLDDVHLGRYRRKQVYIVDQKGTIHYRPPNTNLVPNFMKDFIKWVNSKEALELHPVIHAAIVHYQFVTIHPFIDGNGRTGRALATLILYLRGFDTKRIFALDDYYNENRAVYYKILNTTQKSKSQDTTQWLDYFTAGVMKSMLKVKRRIMQLSIERTHGTKQGQIYLTAKQFNALEHLKRNGSITNRQYQEINQVSNKSAYMDLEKMLKARLLIMQGHGRAVKYLLKK